MRNCSKPACPRPAAAVLGYDYAGRTAVLEDAPEGAISPHLYPLCIGCAGRLQPPTGWVLEDHRSRPRVVLESEVPAPRRGGVTKPARTMTSRVKSASGRSSRAGELEVDGGSHDLSAM